MKTKRRKNNYTNNTLILFNKASVRVAFARVLSESFLWNYRSIHAVRNSFKINFIIAAAAAAVRARCNASMYIQYTYKKKTMLCLARGATNDWVIQLNALHIYIKSNAGSIKSLRSLFNCHMPYLLLVSYMIWCTSDWRHRVFFYFLFRSAASFAIYTEGNVYYYNI